MTQMGQMRLSKQDPQTYAIIGAGMEVHSQLGAGFLESVYHEAFGLELRERQIPYQREVVLPVMYKDQPLSGTFKADFVCYGEVLVEIKALSRIGPAERAQVINYLKATELGRGMLLNFGTGKLEFERFIHTRKPSAPSASSAENRDATDADLVHVIDA